MCALALGHDGIGSDLWRWGAHNIIKFLRGEMLRDSGQEVRTGEMQNGYILFYRLFSPNYISVSYTQFTA